VREGECEVWQGEREGFNEEETPLSDGSIKGKY
jgi:hypothetical protein